MSDQELGQTIRYDTCELDRFNESLKARIYEIIGELDKAGVIELRGAKQYQRNVVIDGSQFYGVTLVYTRGQRGRNPVRLVVYGDLLTGDFLDHTILSIDPNALVFTNVEVKFVDGSGNEIYSIQPFSS